MTVPRRRARIPRHPPRCGEKRPAAPRPTLRHLPRCTGIARTSRVHTPAPKGTDHEHDIAVDRRRDPARAETGASAPSPPSMRTTTWRPVSRSGTSRSASPWSSSPPSSARASSPRWHPRRRNRPDRASFPGWARLLIGTISILAAVLAAIQTFLRFAERSERHAQAADWYASIRREIEEVLALPADKRGDPKKVLDALRKEFNKAGRSIRRSARRPGIASRTCTASSSPRSRRSWRTRETRDTGDVARTRVIRGSSRRTHR